MASKLREIEDLKPGELEFELARGGKFVHLQYCISLVIRTFRRLRTYILSLTVKIPCGRACHSRCFPGWRAGDNLVAPELSRMGHLGIQGR